MFLELCKPVKLPPQSRFQSRQGVSSYSFAGYGSVPLAPEAIDLLSVTIVSSPFYINGTIWYAIFCDWLLSFNMILRFIYTVWCSSNDPYLFPRVLSLLHSPSPTGDNFYKYTGYENHDMIHLPSYTSYSVFIISLHEFI